MKQWTVLVKQSKNGECYVELPQEMLDDLKWKEGDTLVYAIDNDEITLKKLSAD